VHGSTRTFLASDQEVIIDVARRVVSACNYAILLPNFASRSRAVFVRLAAGQSLTLTPEAKLGHPKV
jgi:hypothetical protein